MVGALTTAVAASPSAGSVPEPTLSNRCAAHVPEAARRSGLPEEVVMRVMLAESRGNSRIVSAKGAIGCMQIMPATWSYVTARYNLGADPFDARMNMIGGAMYLAELAARYGWPGAFSAYNAGPGRYQRYVQGHVPLPAETIAYTARLGRNAEGPPVVAVAPRWQEARLFMTRPRFEGAAVLPATPIASRETAGGRLRNPLFPLSVGPDGGAATSAAP
ncbi:lytic transglycosylase domain-containing protein [Sphingomonas sp.]|uniref:lytic transglycosylase domain-containing protein n=1 Tax=Sphingomonas sp. TaxID=28214 RepID=UPI0025EFDB12|nr:lytic transglycosylase domain-containing protein [Sphingomonas sp.]